MKSDEELLSFLDLLDLDEEIIDLRIKSIIKKTNLSNEKLTNLLHLLHYKHLINVKEGTECENDQEFMLVNNLLSNIKRNNVDLTAKIINMILLLNPSSIVSKSEHLLQQILADMYIPSPNNCNEMENDKLNSTLLYLKVCKSILDAVITSGQQLSLPFLETPLEHIVCSQHDELNHYFLTSVIPGFFEGISGYHILDRIWNLLQHLDQKEVSLRVLCSLSNYYLPTSNNYIFKSDIISNSEFWDTILFGLSSNSAKNRKFSMYLFKRALDSLILCKKNIYVKSECTFMWKFDRKEELRRMWNKYFVLIDSLEEKQSNIVLPSLTLINTLKDVGYCWLSCALKMGLSHDNTQVRFKCIHYGLQYPINSINKAISLLEAINDTNLYGDMNQYETLKNDMKISLKSACNLLNIIKTMPLIKWAPVPLFYITRTLSELEMKLSVQNEYNILKIFINLLKIPCNNIVIRKAICVNLITFIGKCSRLEWLDYVTIYSNLPTEINLDSNETGNMLMNLIKTDLSVPEDEKKKFLEVMKSNVNIDFALVYFAGHDSTDFKDLLNKMIDKIKNVSERQYCRKMECFNEVVFVTEFYRKVMSGVSKGTFIDTTFYVCKPVLNYVKSLLSSEDYFDIDNTVLLFEGLNIMIANSSSESKEFLLQLHKSALLVLKNTDVDLNKKVLSIFTLNATLKSTLILDNIDKSDIFTTILRGLKFSTNESNESVGRMRNTFYEKSCEIFYLLIKKYSSIPGNNDTLNFINHIIDSGGYGCLNWILQIMNAILPSVINSNLKYDISQFLCKVWKEIEELKSNNQYSICMKQFVALLLQDSLLQKSIYNNIILMYCTKIIEYGSLKSLPLYYLIKEIDLKHISSYSHMTYIFSDILLYSIVPKKENRISEEVIENIFKDSQYNICKQNDFHFTSHIRYLSILALSKINEPEVLNAIVDFIIKRVDETFKNKQRYHGNSQVHRTVQSAIQNLLFITLKSRSVNIEKIGLWCMELLGKLPHQHFVRTCLEWYISLYIYIKGLDLSHDILERLQSKNVPITSQFLILYFVLKRKIQSGNFSIEEYECVMDVLLSHTMGPTYSIRLYAQYLSHRIKHTDLKVASTKYDYFLEVIELTLSHASADKDKSYQKLLKDYFVHKFDIVEYLTPFHIYHNLPMSDNMKENIDVEFFDDIMDRIVRNIEGEAKDSFYNEWRLCRKPNEYSEDFQIYDVVQNLTESNEAGTIQKKYVPWKNMSDVNVYSAEEKKNKSDLIVVASLIDRLPNLGGMARTSEVFGVLTYVVDSLRHLQDKQFQGLSVSAERWINVEEIRPGQPLKDYLMLKKSEGYSIVAAEQTSSSTSLQKFQFPKKTLLLLGHEKEGVPCDLLPLMDFCVEIPQQGVIRSLNVHVTAAIFIWEYARQNML